MVQPCITQQTSREFCSRVVCEVCLRIQCNLRKQKMDEEVVEEEEVNKETARFELYLKVYFNMEIGKLCMIRNALWS